MRKCKIVLYVTEADSLRSDVLSQEAAVAQKSRPQLDSHNAEDEKDKEAEEEDVS